MDYGPKEITAVDWGTGHGYTTKCLLWTSNSCASSLALELQNDRHWVLLHHDRRAFSSTKKNICGVQVYPFSGGNSKGGLHEKMTKALTKRSPIVKKHFKNSEVRDAIDYNESKVLVTQLERLWLLANCLRGQNDHQNHQITDIHIKHDHQSLNMVFA